MSFNTSDSFVIRPLTDMFTSSHDRVDCPVRQVHVRFLRSLLKRIQQLSIASTFRLLRHRSRICRCILTVNLPDAVYHSHVP